MEDQDYLVHYGVLGMKWGMHRAAKTGTSYSYKSMKTKRLEKSAANAQAKGKKNASKLSAKAAASKKSDANRQKYAKKTSVGKALAQNLLLGTPGAISYQKMRANGTSRGKAAAAHIISGVAGGVVAGFLPGARTVGGAVARSIATQAIGETARYIPGNAATTKSAKKKKSK